MDLPPSFITDISAILAALGVGVATYFLLLKQHQANGLLEAFKVLGTEEHREARKSVYRLYDKYQKENDLKIFFGDKNVEIVRGDFDLMGTLIRSKSIHKKNFLRQFGPTAYLCWKRLEGHIDEERTRRKFPPYMRDFEWIATEAEKFWRNDEDGKIELADINVY
jgi:hypothetical protein